MIKVSVVIPFFQRQPNILRCAVQSVLNQELPANIDVDVIIIDDGSPVSAQSEINDLIISSPFHLTVIEQENGGVVSARNAGLKYITAETDYVAFLDSDDMWAKTHLAEGITALEEGRDLYFCDNERPGHYSSQFRSNFNLIVPYIAERTDQVIELPADELLSIMLRDLPNQTSTTIYRRKCAANLFFDRSLKTAGEDMLFYLNLCRLARRVCFSPKVNVKCGEGINMYFSNLGWDAPGHLQQVIDRLRSHILIFDQLKLVGSDAKFNSGYIALLRRKTAFLMLRHLIKTGKFPAEIKQMIEVDNGRFIWLFLYSLQVLIGKTIRVYRPT